MYTQLDCRNLTVGYADQVILAKQDNGYTNTLFCDNVEVKVPTRMLLLNSIFWEPNMKFGVMPESTDFFNIKTITTDSIKNIQTKLYKKALSRLPDVMYMRIVMEYLYNIDRLSNFVQQHMGGYMPSIDALGLARLLANPAIKKLTDYEFDDKLGPKVAEKQIDQMTKELLAVLKDPNTVDNCLLPYMQAGTLNNNQIPQFLLAYGPRSDIDDTIKRHTVGNSSFGGLKSVEDFATETLSAKKSIYFSRSVIRDSQYFGRKLRLACPSIKNIYPGSCGSPGWIPYTIDSNISHNYVDRIIIDEKDNRILLTKENINEYVDKPIRLVSQFACRHTDGFCERCAGYGEDMLSRHMPPQVHIGLLSASKVSSVVSQKILSAKHLVKVITMLYNLPDLAQSYMYKVEDTIRWKKHVAKKLTNCKVRIPTDTILRQVSDLNLSTLPNAESYSKIPFIELMMGDEVVERIVLEADMFVPYLSMECIQFLHDNYRSIEVDDDFVTFPMAGFDITKPFMKFITLNDDMITYTERVAKFLTSQIYAYTNVSDCIRDFNLIVYQKSAINSFFIETVLRSHMIANEHDYRIPVVTDFNNVRFGNLADVVTESSVSSKLAFEKVGGYLSKPSTALRPKKYGLFAPYFGLLEE